MTSALTVKIKGSSVNAVAAKLDFRTINQGHMLFSTILDNLNGQYNGAFDAEDPAEIYFNNVRIFKGIVDSAKHVVDQEQKWNFMDYLRVSGRDLSFELSNLKYTRSWDKWSAVESMIAEAIVQTGCTLGFNWEGTAALIGGHTSEDQYLLDLVREVLQKAGYEGLTQLDKILQTFPIGSNNRNTGISIDNSNCLGIPEYTEIEGSDIRNAIKVFGNLKLYEPEIRDVWTEDSLDGWYLEYGDDLYLSAPGGGKVGDRCVCAQGNPYLPPLYMKTVVYFVFPQKIPVGLFGQYTTLGCYLKIAPNPSPNKLRVFLFDAWDNYVYTDIEVFTGYFQYFEFPLGYEQVYSDDFPDGIWHKGNGEIDWLNIVSIWFDQQWDGEGPAARIEVDDLWLGQKRVHGAITDFASYSKREFTKITEASTNEEAQKDAEETLAQMKNPIQSMRATVPASTFIVDGVWKGLVGHRIDFYGITYRIIDLTVDIAPYQNLRDGYDAIATLNAVPVSARIEPDAYASVINPRSPSLLRRFKQKTES